MSATETYALRYPFDNGVRFLNKKCGERGRGMDIFCNFVAESYGDTDARRRGGQIWLLATTEKNAKTALPNSMALWISVFDCLPARRLLRMVSFVLSKKIIIN